MTPAQHHARTELSKALAKAVDFAEVGNYDVALNTLRPFERSKPDDMFLTSAEAALLDSVLANLDADHFRENGAKRFTKEICALYVLILEKDQ